MLPTHCKNCIRTIAVCLMIALLWTTAVFAAERPQNYYPIAQTVTLPDGGYCVSKEHIGLKVIWINKALLDTDHDRYTQETEEAVLKLQAEHDLPTSGIVDEATWLAMGYSADEWQHLGTYCTPLKVNANSTRAQCVNAMVETAESYLGTPYRIGCSGKPGTYIDCSGLIFQCLYSIGVDPDINIVDHALAVNEYTSRDLAADKRLGKAVPIEDIKRGDFIFFGDRNDPETVCHVGIYVGNGEMIDSWPFIGTTRRALAINRPIHSVIRILPDGNAPRETIDRPIAAGGFLLPRQNAKGAWLDQNDAIGNHARWVTAKPLLRFFSEIN